MGLKVQPAEPFAAVFRNTLYCTNVIVGLWPALRRHSKALERARTGPKQRNFT